MKKLSLLSLLFIFIKVNAQGNTDPTNYKKNEFEKVENLFSTPEISQFQRVNFFENNLYVGKANINIPIFEIDYGDIKVPISLLYDSGGIKIDDIATNVGIGWSLEAGGSIIKNVKDIEDNTFNLGYFGKSDSDQGWVKYRFVSQLGYNRNIKKVETLDKESSYLADYYEKYGQTDSSPDLYHISTSKIRGSFFNKWDETKQIFTPIQISGNELLFKNISLENIKTGSLNALGFDNRTIKGLENMHNSIKVGANPLGTPIIIKETELYPLTAFKSIEFKDSKGINYKFNDVDIIETISSVWLNDGGYMAQFTATNPFGYDTNVTTLNLSELKDYNNNIVQFIYDKYTNPYVFKNTAKSKEIRDVFNPMVGDYSMCEIGLYPDNFSEKYRSLETYNIYRQKNRLKNINWNNNTVEFKYLKDRLDHPNEKSLDEIIIKSGNEIIQKIVFEYDYLKSKENCNEWYCYRLKLNKIKYLDKNNININEYNFEYYEDNKLPKIHSSQQDFLGFYNNNGIEQLNSDDFKVPTLYFHKNQGKYSILPFKKEDGSFTKILQGDYSLLPDAKYASTGLLKKIIYPTKGYSEFEYESNDFILNNLKYTSGGVRLKKQILNDGSNLLTRKYIYEDNGVSSGIINNLPVFGLIWGFNPDNIDKMAFILYDKPKNDIELTQGAFVGYSKVTEIEEGNGRKEYHFTNPKQYPNEAPTPVFDNLYSKDLKCFKGLLSNSAYPFNAYINNDILRGKELIQKIYGNNDVLLKEVKSDYTRKIFSDNTINFQKYINSYYEDLQDTTPMGLSFKFINKLRIERNLLSKQETKEYLDGEVITNTKEITYDDIYPFVEQEKHYNSKGEVLTTNYEYPFDWANNGNSMGIALTNSNRLSDPLKINEFNGGKLLSSTYIEYNRFNDILQKSRIFQKKDSDNYQDSDVAIYYNSYDIYGNITQYTNGQNGIPVSIIWGYNGQYPVAKIEGSIYTDVVSKLSSYLTKIQNGTLTATEETTIRGLIPTSMITTYQYKPLIGVTKIVQSNGLSENYKYDSANRLEEIRNDKEEIIKKIEYKLKPIYGNDVINDIIYKDCGNQFSEPIEYTINANRYHSLISVEDANVLAKESDKQAAINFANNVGSCTVYDCGFSRTTNFTFGFSSLSKFAPNTTRLQFAFYVSSNDVQNINYNWNQGVYIGNVSGTCRPSKREYFTSTSVNSNAEVAGYIDPNGNVYITLKNYIANNYISVDVKFNRK